MLRYLLSGDFISAIIFLFSTMVVVFLVTPLHEFSHAFIANKLGDSTAQNQGRLTMNPFAHIDWIGASLIMFCGFGWANPVPVNPHNFRYSKVGMKGGMVLTALAGPVSNIIAAIIFSLVLNLLYLILPFTSVTVYILLFFEFIVAININLAVFNFFPIPPLDGSKILFGLLPSRYYFVVLGYERYLALGLFALLILGVLDVPLAFLTNAVGTAIDYISSLPFKFIG